MVREVTEFLKDSRLQLSLLVCSKETRCQTGEKAEPLKDNTFI